MEGWGIFWVQSYLCILSLEWSDQIFHKSLHSIKILCIYAAWAIQQKCNVCLSLTLCQKGEIHLNNYIQFPLKHSDLKHLCHSVVNITHCYIVCLLVPVLRHTVVLITPEKPLGNVKQYNTNNPMLRFLPICMLGCVYEVISVCSGAQILLDLFYHYLWDCKKKLNLCTFRRRRHRVFNTIMTG